jgi:sugar/nucleoside kinase (ribokinase family)
VKRFYCLGSLNADVTFDVPRMPEEHEKLRCARAYLTPGGSAANTACWLARLNARVHMLGAVGSDPLGDWCVDALRHEGVDVSLVQRSRRFATGVAAVFVNPDSKRMVTSGGANADFDPSLIDIGVFGPDTHLHAATPLDDIVLPLTRAAKGAGATVSCDLDELPGAGLAGLVDVCFMNRTALERWGGALAMRDAFAASGLSASAALVVTLGAEGAAAVASGAQWRVPVRPATVVDRTGGGDAFDAAFLDAWVRGAPLPECLAAGARLAREVVARYGSRPDGIDLAALRERSGTAADGTS